MRKVALHLQQESNEVSARLQSALKQSPMSAAEDQRKRLEALRKKKEEVRLKQQGIAERYNDVIGGMPTGASTAAGDLSQSETTKPVAPKHTGPSIEFKNFVGVYSIAPKQKPYMYNQGIQVNKNDIDLTLELQQEENQIGFVPSKEDEKKDDDEENFDERKKEKKVHQFSEDEVEKVFAKPNFKRFIRKGSDILEQQLSDTEPLIDDLIDRNDDAVQGTQSNG